MSKFFVVMVTSFRVGAPQKLVLGLKRFLLYLGIIKLIHQFLQSKFYSIMNDYKEVLKTRSNVNECNIWGTVISGDALIRSQYETIQELQKKIKRLEKKVLQLKKKSNMKKRHAQRKLVLGSGHSPETSDPTLSEQKPVSLHDKESELVEKFVRVGSDFFTESLVKEFPHLIIQLYDNKGNGVNIFKNEKTRRDFQYFLEQKLGRLFNITPDRRSNLIYDQNYIGIVTSQYFKEPYEALTHAKTIDGEKYKQYTIRAGILGMFEKFPVLNADNTANCDE